MMDTDVIPGAGDLHVLAVDDNMMTLTFTRSLLEYFGFKNIDVAMNGQDALDKIHESEGMHKVYDIIFIDWNMPGMSGYDLLRFCREDRFLDNTAVIMITAESQKRNMLEAAKAGATSYIIKPVSKDDMHLKICQTLSRRMRLKSVRADSTIYI
ncbi:MAG: response regulator [Micavibrio aeruginosavorus]|nr:response regulator [Micavibrio aeruginosavorus]